MKSTLTYGLRGLCGRLINAPIEEDHDKHGGVERAHSAVDYVAGLLKNEKKVDIC